MMLKKIFKQTTVLSLFIWAMLPFFSCEYDENDPAAAAEDFSLSREIVNGIAEGNNEIIGEGVPYDSGEYGENSDAVTKWGSGGINKTHQWISARAIYVLDQRFGNQVVKPLYDWAAIILEYTDKPDLDELIWFMSGHFWNPDDGKSIFGIKSITAYEKFRKHAFNAVKFYSSEKKRSFQELGRSLHFLEDISETHHSTNMDALFYPSHIIYEKWIDTNKQFYTISWPDKIGQYPGTFDFFTSSTLYGSANNSKQYRDYIGDSKKYDIVASSCLKWAQNDVAAYLYRFLQEVGEIE